MLTLNDVDIAVIDHENQEPSTPLLPEAIPGASLCLRNLKPGESKVFTATQTESVILMSINGDFEFQSGEKKVNASGRYVFIPGCDQSATITATTPSSVLEILWRIPETDLDAWAHSDREFPYVQDYASAVQYRDKNKSDKTISRELVRQRLVPGFCMGSVESYGYDKVAQHPHPMLDQFFFSFPENDMDVLIEDFRAPMKGDTLLHIPLGSNHGVEVSGDNHMHYIWIDFFLGQAGLDRLDRAHIPTGASRSFDGK